MLSNSLDVVGLGRCRTERAWSELLLLSSSSHWSLTLPEELTGVKHQDEEVIGLNWQ